MCIIYRASKIRHKNIKKIAVSIKMLNLSKNDLRFIAKKKKMLVVIKICQKMN